MQLSIKEVSRADDSTEVYWNVPVNLNTDVQRRAHEVDLKSIEPRDPMIDCDRLNLA